MHRKILLSAILLMVTAGFFSSPVRAEQAFPKSVEKATSKHPLETRAHEGWTLAIESYTFKKFTFFEGVDKTIEAGLRYTVGSGGRVISNDFPNIKFDQLKEPGRENTKAREAVKKKLREAGLKMVGCYVTLPNNEAECRKVFDFAAEMGFDVMVAEPKYEALDLIEELCKQYNMKVALHNHPAPSLYWHPDMTLKALEGRSELMGVCADTGHWMRCGINPVWALEKLQGRIICLHLKDLNNYGKVETHDVPWGTGKGKVKEVLEELTRQKFKGIIAIEYEYNWENSVPDIKQCVDYFNKVVAELPKE